MLKLSPRCAAAPVAPGGSASSAGERDGARGMSSEWRGLVFFFIRDRKKETQMSKGRNWMFRYSLRKLLRPGGVRFWDDAASSSCLQPI